jgi:hypothetical protein
MRIFKNKWFDHWARKARVSDDQLREVAAEIERGLIDANLGGDVYKKRVGQRGAYRFIVVFRQGERLLFYFAFPKSERQNISDKELTEAKSNARVFLSMDDEQLGKRIKAGKYFEI